MLLQIGYIICFADTTSKASIKCWSLIKCKRVTNSVLATELYKIVHEFDIWAVIKVIIWKILRSAVSLILFADLKSLYDYLINLGTI